MAVIGIDFDGTLVRGDKAIPGAKEAVNLLRERGHKIVITSCNRLDWIKQTLNNLDIRYDAIYGKESNKPLCDLYVDDRNYFFQGHWPTAANEILERLQVGEK